MDDGFSYRSGVIGFLRFLGILIAAVWFGAALFLILGAEPAVFSDDARVLLQKSHFYLSTLLAQTLRTRFFYWCLACGAAAFGHLFIEWLYLGRAVSRISIWLLTGLLVMVLTSGGLVQPRLKHYHSLRVLGATPAERQKAESSFAAWLRISYGMDFLVLGGLAVYLWRMANPPDTLRFLGPAKLRS